MRIIDGHDSRREALSLDDALVRDADKLFRLTPHGVDTVMEWFGLSRGQAHRLIGSRVHEHLFTDAARTMAGPSPPSRRSTPAPSGRHRAGVRTEDQGGGALFRAEDAWSVGRISVPVPHGWFVKESLTLLAVAHEVLPVELPSGPARRRRFSWTPPDGVRVLQRQLYFVVPGTGFTATATTPEAQVHRFAEVFDDILRRANFW